MTAFRRDIAMLSDAAPDRSSQPIAAQFNVGGGCGATSKS
jgi:hypothetical protein